MSDEGFAENGANSAESSQQVKSDSKKIRDLIPRKPRAKKEEEASISSDEGSERLADFKLERLENEIETLKQVLQERIDIHGIRRLHTWILLLVAIGWILVIRDIVIDQGLRRLNGQDFLLSDAVTIAFITSTTATVLGYMASLLIGSTESRLRRRRRGIRRTNRLAIISPQADVEKVHRAPASILPVSLPIGRQGRYVLAAIQLRAAHFSVGLNSTPSETKSRAPLYGSAIIAERPCGRCEVQSSMA